MGHEDDTRVDGVFFLLRNAQWGITEIKGITHAIGNTPVYTIRSSLYYPFPVGNVADTCRCTLFCGCYRVKMYLVLRTSYNTAPTNPVEGIAPKRRRQQHVVLGECVRVTAMMQTAPRIKCLPKRWMDTRGTARRLLGGYCYHRNIIIEQKGTRMDIQVL